MNTYENPINATVAPLNIEAAEQARARQAQLTKPAGSLGQLEAIAIRLAAMQNRRNPQVERINISIFAADHGIMAEGVSAFPQSVTCEMIRNFAGGGAAISVLAKQLDADLNVINVGTVAEMEAIAGVSDQRVSAGTANFSEKPAMQQTECHQALLCGKADVDRALATGIDLYIAGDMGIGNTTATTAIACALLNLSPTQLTGFGTGITAIQLSHKITVIEQALAQHKASQQTATDVLRTLGGLEIAAITGAYLHCAQRGVPVLVDGYICSVAALLATKMSPGCEQWFIFSHQSAEPGHRFILQALQARPLLDLDMRLGEASGAAVAVPLLRLSCALHNKMSTFSEAAVSEKQV